MTKVTILVPSYNPGNYLNDALISVFKQSYTDWKMIIIDDDSSDNSLKNASKLLSDSRIQVIRNKKNLGQSQCLNIGLSYVETPYVIQLDADDWLEPNTLEIMVKEMDNQPEDIAVLSGNMRIVFQNDKGKVIRTKVKKGRLFNDKYDFLLANTSLWPRFYRTTALKEIGGWPVDDPYQGRYVEDLSVLIRLIEHFRFHWIDKVFYNHRRHSHNMTYLLNKFAEVVEFSITQALKRWGNEFVPVFATSKEGSRYLSELIPVGDKPHTVTVLIPTYNAGKYLKKAVNSVIEQSYKEWKLIIIDDASTDTSINSIKQELKDKRIKLVRNKQNIGQGKSLNIGLTHVKTPYIIQLDADDWFEPDTLKIMVEAMGKLPKNIAVLSGNMRVIYENENGKFIKSKNRKGRFFKNKYDFLLSNSSVWPRFYRTAALKDVGGWPTNGPYEGRYIEDLRILFRLIEKYRFYWLNHLLYNHRRHLSNQTKEIKPMVKTIEWLIPYTLKRWGNHYKPIFSATKNGYKRVFKLVPVHTQSKKKITSKVSNQRQQLKKRKEWTPKEKKVYSSLPKNVWLTSGFLSRKKKKEE